MSDKADLATARLIEILRQCAEAGDLLCGDAADEIDRLRLTDAERQALEFACSHGETVDASWRYTLRGLLERMR